MLKEKQEVALNTESSQRDIQLDTTNRISYRTSAESAQISVFRSRKTNQRTPLIQK